MGMHQHHVRDIGAAMKCTTPVQAELPTAAEHQAKATKWACTRSNIELGVPKPPQSPSWKLILDAARH